jgi:hypothetical protein
MRTYRQFATLEGGTGLGPIITLSPARLEFNMNPKIIPLESGESARSAATSKTRVHIIWSSGDESDDEVDFLESHGLYGMTIDVDDSIPLENEKPGSDLEIIEQNFYDSENFGLGYIAAVLPDDNRMFALGFHVEILKGEGYRALAGFYELNQNQFSVRDFSRIGTKFIENSSALPRYAHQFYTADMENLIPADEENNGESKILAAVCNFEYDILSFTPDSDNRMIKNLGDGARNVDTIVDQRLISFGLDSAADVSATKKEKSTTILLYLTNKGQIRYRSLLVDGKAKGATEFTFSIGDREITSLDAAIFGEDLLVAYAHRANRLRSEILIRRVDFELLGSLNP